MDDYFSVRVTLKTVYGIRCKSCPRLKNQFLAVEKQIVVRAIAYTCGNTTVIERCLSAACNRR